MQNPDRGKLRMEKLKQLELEQLQWDREALVMPEYLDRALLLSFESVKTEFSDLDGLSWPRDCVEEPTPKLACAEIDTRRPSDTRSSRPPSRAGMQDTVRLAQPPRGPVGDPPLACHRPTLRSHR